MDDGVFRRCQRVSSLFFSVDTNYIIGNYIRESIYMKLKVIIVSPLLKDSDCYPGL